MRRLLLSSTSALVLLLGGLGLQPASADGYPPCTVTGTSSNETITGTEGNDVICTGGGNDTVNALGGNDIIIVSGSGIDTINGGSGNDTIDASLGSDSTIDAGLGDDTVYGTPGDDEITAGDGSDTVDGNAGDDTIAGGDGSDTINGDTGNDIITGDTGDDSITGGDGNDTLNGTAGDDSLVGGEGADNLNGGDGTDNLEGNAGNDNLFGQSGTDTLSGSQGDDIMAGGEGIDNLDGGVGLNVCDYTSGEVLTTTCRYDDAAPSFSGYALSPSTVDVGSSEANLVVHVDVDDQTGIYQVYLKCGPWPNGAFVKFLTFDGTSKHIAIDERVTVPFGTAPGDYGCDIFTIDSLGKTSNWVSTGVSLTVTRTPPGQPSQPRLFSFSSTDPSTISLSWLAPVNVGSPQLSSYTIQYSVDNSVWLNIPSGSTSGTSISVAGLRAGTDYWFRVRGENGGTSGQDTTFMNLSWAVLKARTLDAGFPLAPTNLYSSSITNSSFKLNWSSPIYDGGSTLSDYKIESSRDGGASWQSIKNSVSTSTSLTVSGAAPGTTYLIRVAAVNAAGQSEYLTGAVTTLTTTSSAPKALVASSVANSSLFLGWGLPDSNGGSAITDYQVEVTSNGSNSWTVIPHSASNRLGFSVSNLLSGRTYQFRVAAVTSAGLGAYSNVITVTTLGGVTPNAPASFTIGAVKTNAASVSWSAVTATSKVSNYLVDVSTDGATWTSVSKKVSTSTSLSLSGLRLGTSYQVRVAAVNANGVGDYVYGSFTTLATVSAAPTGLVSSGVSGSGFTLNWTAPSSNGGSAISDYVVEVNGGGFSWSPIVHDPSANTTITVTGLNPAVKYSIRLKALNSVGVSKASSALNVTTLAVLPATPVISLKSVTATGAVITWTAPNNGGAKISDYLAEYSTDNGQTWKTVVKTASSSTSLTLKNLKTKTSYLFRISAKNTVGYSNPSQDLAVTTS